MERASERASEEGTNGRTDRQTDRQMIRRGKEGEGKKEGGTFSKRHPPLCPPVLLSLSSACIRAGHLRPVVGRATACHCLPCPPADARRFAPIHPSTAFRVCPFADAPP
eukprot:1889481-Rhodomonas_salina.1